jgi:tRNA (guanine-N7-)-methyltransferase
MSAPQVKPISFQELVFQPASYIERIRLHELFGQAQPIEIELGAGDGSFLVQWASLHPERNFLGVERLLGRLRKVCRKAVRQGLYNVKMMRIEAAYFVEYLLPPQSISALHIYFPDPWPKRKQRKNRLIENRFVEATANTLTAGGTFFLRTDDRDYFEQMQDRFQKNSRFERVETPTELRAVLTDFERGFLARGVQTLHAAYRKRD